MAEKWESRVVEAFGTDAKRVNESPNVFEINNLNIGFALDIKQIDELKDVAANGWIIHDVKEKEPVLSTNGQVICYTGDFVTKKNIVAAANFLCGLLSTDLYNINAKKSIVDKLRKYIIGDVTVKTALDGISAQLYLKCVKRLHSGKNFTPTDIKNNNLTPEENANIVARIACVHSESSTVALSICAKLLPNQPDLVKSPAKEAAPKKKVVKKKEDAENNSDDDDSI
jgi:hypothetical protein